MIPRSLQLLYKECEYDEHGRKRIGSWSQSYSGSMYWIMDPRSDEVNLIDIAVGLSNAARYRGQTKFFYPVLTHCVLVSRGVEKLALEAGWSFKMAKMAAFEGLLHDATEAYLGDVARPLKRQPAMKEYCKVEAKWEKVIHDRFLINSTKQTAALVKEVDQRIVLDEIQVLMKDPDMWRRHNRYPDLKPLDIDVGGYQTQEQVIKNFTSRYRELKPDDGLVCNWIDMQFRSKGES